MIPPSVKSCYYAINRNVSPFSRLLSHRLANLWNCTSDKPIVYCIGDSHNRVFNYIKRNKLAPNIQLRCVTVKGATIFGLANPNSKSNALPIFKRELTHAPAGSMLTILLGEIDCGFLIWLRAEKNGTTVEEELHQSLMRYRDFITWTASLKLKKIAIISVPPQTITDDIRNGEVAKQRSSISVNYEQRNSLTRHYNAQLRQMAKKYNYHFISMDHVLLEAESGLVRNDLLNPDPCDHHLDNKLVAPLYAEELINFVSNQ